VGLPNVVIFQILLPLVSPSIDIMFVVGAVSYFVNRHFHPESANPSDFQRLMIYFALFMIIDFIIRGCIRTGTAAAGPQAQLLTSGPSVVATVCLSAAVLDRSLQDPEPGSRRWIVFLGQTGPYGHGETTGGGGPTGPLTKLVASATSRWYTVAHVPRKDYRVFRRPGDGELGFRLSLPGVA
jgi:hypothetical protein